MEKHKTKDVESGKNKGVGETAEERSAAEPASGENGGTAAGGESRETEKAKAAEEAPAEKGRTEDKDQDLNDKYLRLYAEFENYRKRVSREKEDLIRHGNESLLYELLPAIDHLELALKHASRDSDNGIVQGVEITLKELHRTLEKFGLRRIESEGRSFDPSIHHAMAQVEREDMEEKMVAEEFRAGYLYRDKVLRPSLVAVSVKPGKSSGQAAESGDIDEGGSSDEHQIEINENIEEE